MLAVLSLLLGCLGVVCSFISNDYLIEPLILVVPNLLLGCLGVVCSVVHQRVYGRAWNCGRAQLARLSWVDLFIGFQRLFG